MYNKIIDYFRDGLWQIQREENNSELKKLALRYLKIFTLSTTDFIKDHGSLRASALTLYTLLSIVPVIAMFFGIAKGFGLEKTLEQQLLEQVPDQDTMILQLIEMARNMLDSTKGGVVAGFGVVLLFWTVIKVISNIEESFNHIWNVQKSRSIGRKLSDYLSLMLLAPILIIAASSISVFVQTQLTSLISEYALPGTIFALYALSYLPILILWLLFSFLFMFMPNTRVNYSSGMFAGIFSGTLFYIVQSVYVSLQIGVSSYNAIYGSFAALPLFLVWLQITWMVVLFGSELSFFHQNIALYQFNQKFKKLNFNAKNQLALYIMHAIIERFNKTTELPYSTKEITLHLQLPLSISKSLLTELSDCKLLSKIYYADNPEPHYQPAYNISLLSDEAITEALKNNGENYTIAINQV
ncbi:MAG: YihY/virulence factor BrkB family protein [Methyloprofundus sp.]|nr:YihY/virulence factor BrkB family protein [Methyloprofundus sp.]MBW6453264.1 YihY/virulence factor BrkB family protein [Methyloprofundus sp.]